MTKDIAKSTRAELAQMFRDLKRGAHTNYKRKECFTKKVYNAAIKVEI